MTNETLPLESNLLLASLPAESLDMLRSATTVEEVPIGERIFEVDELPDLYFPLDGIISLVRELEDGTSVEVGMIGAEGMTGTMTLLRTGSPLAGVVQGRGLVARCNPDTFRDRFGEDANLREMILRWQHVMLTHATQSAACNRVHEATLRLARWLLLLQDRSASDEMSVTQEFLGLMLGARRATINEAMRTLVDSGSIEHRRARVRVLDRKLLEEQSCECYSAAVIEYEKTFGFTPRTKVRVTPVD